MFNVLKKLFKFILFQLDATKSFLIFSLSWIAK